MTEQTQDDDFVAMQKEALAAGSGRADGAPASQIPHPDQPTPAAVPPSAAPHQPAGDSMAQDYQAHKGAIDDQAAFEQMQHEAGQGQQQGSATPQQTQPAKPQPKGSDPSGWQPGVPMVYDADKHQYVPDPNVQEDGIGIKDVAKDVGKGLLEAPVKGIIGGARDALEAMYDGADKLTNWAADKAGLDLSFLGKFTSGPVDKHGDPIDSEGNVKPLLPEVNEPTTKTAKAVRGIAQFTTSMVTMSKAFGLANAPSTVKGALALFAGFQGKGNDLSNAIQDTPLANPVSDFLAAKPDDNEAEGRLKKAVEGVVVGKLADGFIQGLRLLKNGSVAQNALDAAPEDAPLAEEPQAPTEAAAPKPSALDALGDATESPDQPLVGTAFEKRQAAQFETMGMTPQQVKAMQEPAGEGELAGPKVPGATEAQAKEPQVYVNFARINGPDDVKRAMSQMLDVQKDNVDAARRGIQTFEQTKLGAQFEDAWTTLMDRRVGQPLNAEQQLASRQLLAQSAMKTQEVMQSALDDPTPENLFAFRKMMTTHAMIQKEVIGSQTEIARALSAMRIPVDMAGTDRLSQISDNIEQLGGYKSNLDFMLKAKTLMDAGRLEDLGNVAEKGLYARTRDALLNAWTNGLISNPLTHIKVALSNVCTIALRLTETRIAESLDKLMGNDAGVAAGETAQTAAGLVQSIKDSFRYIAKSGGLSESEVDNNPVANAVTAFKTGNYTGNTVEGGGWGANVEEQLANESNQMSDSGWLGKGMDLLQQTIRTPGRALTAEHQFFKSVGMRMELNRFAIRQATEELNAGKLASEDFNGRIAELVENPPSAMMDKAVSGQTYQTFTDAPGKLAESIEKIRDDFPLTRAIIPFYKIPSRMMSFTFERSPLAPLMSTFRANVAAGGARQSMALAQMGLGSSVMLATADAVLNGQITGMGPRQKGQRLAMENEGWQPYSIKVGDRWIQYNRLETIGSSMAMAADATEAIRDYTNAVNTDDPDVTSLAAAVGLSIANDVTSKSYLEGVSRMFEAMANPKEGVKSALTGFAGSLVPGVVGAVARIDDPYQRAVNSMTDAIKARTPGVSKELPPMRNLWGEAVSHESGLGKAYDALVPFASRQAANEPIDAELMRLGMNVNLPSATTTINNAKVNLKEDPAIYSRYVQLAGNETKDPLTGMGTKDTLNALVSGSHPLSSVYNLYQDQGKETMIEGIIKAQRDRAKQELLQEYPQLRDKVDDTRAKQQAMKGMINVGGP
jgi:hypothetical protein